MTCAHNPDSYLNVGNCTQLCDEENSPRGRCMSALNAFLIAFAPLIRDSVERHVSWMFFSGRLYHLYSEAIRLWIRRWNGQDRWV